MPVYDNDRVSLSIYLSPSHSHFNEIKRTALCDLSTIPARLGAVAACRLRLVCPVTSGSVRSSIFFLFFFRSASLFYLSGTQIRIHIHIQVSSHAERTDSITQTLSDVHLVTYAYTLIYSVAGDNLQVDPPARRES